MGRKIESLHLRRHTWGADKGKLVGELEVSSPRGKMTISLDGERALKVLEVVADVLVETARDTAHLIASDILTDKQSALTDESESND